MVLYGEPLESTVNQSHQGGYTAQSQSVDDSNQGNDTREGVEGDRKEHRGGDGDSVGGEEEEGTVKGDTVMGND